MDENGGRSAVLLEALVALAVADRDARLTGAEEARAEVILVGAGLSLSDAARLTGKNYEAVKKSIQRARSKGLKSPSASSAED
jgi:DNA-directed RNA polymerase specialized sigma24 family protein